MRSIVFALVLLAAPVEAATYYVRTDGNDACSGTVDAAGSSGNCAKRTIQAGVNLANPGDTVLVHAGTYTTPAPVYSSVRSGTAGSVIMVRAAPGETVNVSRITISHNFNVVQGFRVVNSGGGQAAGITFSGSNNQALDNTILGNSVPNTGSTGIGMLLSGSFNTVSRNTWDGINNGSNTSFVEGITFNGNDNQFGPNNLIKDFNAIERVFGLYGERNHIFNNEIRNFNQTVSGPHPDVFQTFGTRVSRDHLIENNYIHDLGGTQLGNVECDYPTTNTCGNKGNMKGWVFRNNIFANITSCFFIYFPVEFYNNIFYRVAPGFIAPLSAGSYCNATNCLTVRNNAFIASGTANDGWYSGTGSKDYNYVATTVGGAAAGGFSEPNAVNGGNPGLVAASSNCLTTACNFHLTAASVLINKGQTLSTFAVDLDGATRPQGGAWDIGPYEFGTGPTPPPTSAPNAPANPRLQ